MSNDRQRITEQFANTLEASSIPGLGVPRRLGMLDCYELDRHTLYVVTDRVGAEYPVTGTIPFKGEAATRCALYWLERAHHRFPHALASVIDPQALLTRQLEPLAGRYAVYGRLMGALWDSYAQGERTCEGQRLPDNLDRGAPLQHPVVTWTADGDADPHTRDGNRDAATGSRGVGEGTSNPSPTGRRPELPSSSSLLERARELFTQACATIAGTRLGMAYASYTFGVNAEGAVMSRGLLHAPDTTMYSLADDEGWVKELHEPSIVGDWLASRAGARDDALAVPLDDDVRARLSEAYLMVAQTLDPSFDPRPGRIANRLSYSLSAAEIIA